MAERIVYGPTPEHALMAKNGDAITADVTFLRTPTPTTAAERIVTLEAQVERLTRQVVALMRIVGRDLGSTEGT
jgi:hypothetical protein